MMAYGELAKVIKARIDASLLKFETRIWLRRVGAKQPTYKHRYYH